MAVHLPVDRTLIGAFLFYACIVLLKTLAMAFITAYYRLTRNVFSNAEDVKFLAHPEKAKVKFDDQDVERVRRAHLNDMENVFPFVLIGLLYCLTGPSYSVAVWHFRAFAASRILHTIFYLLQVPQPSRGSMFAIGMVTCVSMAVQSILATI